MKKYQSPEIHFEMIAPEETLLLTHSVEGIAENFDLGKYLEERNKTNPSAMGYDDEF